MSLTSTQAAQVMSALAGKVDQNTFQIVKNLLDLNLQNNDIPEGESYHNIKVYCQRLRDRLIASGKGIVTDDPEQEMLMVYMDREKVKRLFISVPEGGYLAAMPGIHTAPTGEDQLTISLLAADRNLNILDAHIQGSTHGEESWGNRNMMCNLESIFL
jgi:predicted ATP-dependent Lon-type protease